MPKQVLAINCRILNLPEDWSAVINGKGTCVLTVPDYMAYMFFCAAPLIIARGVDINDFTALPFNGYAAILAPYEGDIDISNFYQWEESMELSYDFLEEESNKMHEIKVAHNNFTILNESYKGDIICNNLVIYSPTVIYGNVKAEHILIDHEVFSAYEARITDKGISYIGDNGSLVEIIGTLECLDVHVE
jgi:hypothetical protein